MIRISSLAASALALAVLAASAWAFWTVQGAGRAVASSSSLAPAAISVPGSASGAVTVTWTQQAALVPNAAASSSITYTVERRLGAGSFAPVTGGGCAGRLPHGTTSCTDTVTSNGAYTYRVVAALGSWTATSAEAGPVTVTLDTTPPSVQSINRADATPTSAASVSWTVSFSEPVTGVDATDFALVRTGGLAGGAITSVTGTGTTRTVTASTGTGSGTLGLNLVDDDTIHDTVGNPLAGAGSGNGNFTGQPYTVDLAPPTAQSIVRATADPTNAANLSWTVSFSEPVTGVDATDLALVRTGGLTGGAITSVTGTGTTRTVTASTGTGSGTLGLNLVDDDTIRDTVGNPLAGAGNGSFTGQSYTVDRAAPAVSASVIAKASGWTPGYIKQGGSYYVYANVSDIGSPAGGVASVTANVSAATGGQTAVALSAGSYSAGGIAYNRRSAALTAASPLSEGAKSYTISAADNVGNSSTQAGFSVTVDNTAPSAADIQTANGGAVAGRAEHRDTIIYSFSEPVDPGSILSGWDGNAVDVVVRLNNGNPVQSDTVLVYNAANSTQLSLGTAALGDSGYAAANRTFGVTGTKSRMVLAGNAITVTLGTASGSVNSPLVGATMTWTPTSAAYDRAANAMSTAQRNESGPLDREF